MALADITDATVRGDRDERGGRQPANSRLSPFGRLAAVLEREQDRWFLWVPVLYGGGAAIYFLLVDEPGLITALVPLVAALAVSMVFTRGTLTIVATGMAVAVALGFAAAKLRAEWVRAPVLERQISGAQVRGWVELIEPRAGRGERLTIRVAAIRNITAERLPYRIRVRTMKALAGLKPGDAVRLKATIAPPPIPALPGGYDFARSAYFMRLGGVGYALAPPQIDDQAGPAPIALRAVAAVEHVRQLISRRVRTGLAGERGAIADAMITGERGGISDATNDAYRGSGIFHILSISGLHMTVMAGAVFFALRFALAAIPAIALRYPIKKWAAVLATLAAFGYLMISGAAFATIRSWVMITVMFTAVLLDRPAVALRNVAVSALLILLVRPESLLDIGFQMSFAAVVALVAAYEAIRESRHSRQQEHRLSGLLMPFVFFGGIILTTLIASVAVAPFGVYHFHSSQQYAALANLIAIPVCNLIVMPGALATLVLMPLGLEVLPLWVMGLGIDIMNWSAYRVAGLPGAVARVPAIPVLAFALCVAGGLWLCLWRTRWRVLGVAAIAAGLAIAPTMRLPDILIGRNGQLVAVRGDGGRLIALAGRSTRYELTRWLEHDGDTRSAREVSAAGGFRCDGAGCTLVAGGVLVAVARRQSALADDCSRAGLLVLTFTRPLACARAGPVIDYLDLKANGTHAVYFDRSAKVGSAKAAGVGGGGTDMAPVPGAGTRAGHGTGGGVERGVGAMTITTVAEIRGDRPWSRTVWSGQVRSPRAVSRASRGTWNAGAGRGAGGREAGYARESGSRIGRFSAPYELRDDTGPLRPEVADQDWDETR